MLLTVDIGNTETSLGLFAGDNLVRSWRLTTGSARTPDEWASVLTTLVTQAGYTPAEVSAAAMASVAPAVTESLRGGIAASMGAEPTSIGPSSPLPIRLEVDEPLTVGADRVVNTLAAATIYERDTIVVDFGTATTFDCITREGAFLGGVIAPGVQTAAEDLARKTAKIPATELTPPECVIGRRTEDCVRAGVLFGTADATDGIVRRIKAEWPTDHVPYVVATGGLASLVAKLTTEVEHVEPHLTLLGLRHAARHLGLIE